MPTTLDPGPQDFEAGDIVDVTPAPNLSTVVSVRFSGEDLAVNEAPATRGGQKLSAFVRSAALTAGGREATLPAERVLRALQRFHEDLRIRGAYSYVLAAAEGREPDEEGQGVHAMAAE